MVKLASLVPRELTNVGTRDSRHVCGGILDLSCSFNVAHTGKVVVVVISAAVQGV